MSYVILSTFMLLIGFVIGYTLAKCEGDSF